MRFHLVDAILGVAVEGSEKSADCPWIRNIDGLIGLVQIWLKERGFEPDAEHILIHGVPVQFLPAYNKLVEEGVREARAIEYDQGILVRVVGPEHLVALAVQTGGRKRREHVARLLEVEGFNQARLIENLTRHALLDHWTKEWPQP